MVKNIDPGKLQGTIFAPPSKSYAQRALLAASLASGTSILQNLGNCKDTEALTTVLASLGAIISNDEVTGPISYGSGAAVDVGESGLATRLLVPILALSDNTSYITGRGSLLARNMDFLVAPMRQLGATLSLTDGHLPATVSGCLRPSTLALDCSESSQFLSGLLFALPLLDGNSCVEAMNLASRPYVKMTVGLLSRFGITINYENDIFTIPGNQTYEPASFTVEGDWSGASAIIVAPGCKTIRGLDPASCQADRAIMDVLSLASVHFQQSASDIKIFDTVPSAFSFDATDCPDLFPALAVLATRVRSGESEIIGTDRLANKESNRLLSIRDEFSKFGISIDISVPNKLIIPGGQTVRSASADSHNDHRIAMALASLALCARDGRTTINGAESVSKSYPNFWNDFNHLYRYE